MYENHSPKLWLNFVHFFELHKVDIHFSWFFHIIVSPEDKSGEFLTIYIIIYAYERAKKLRKMGERIMM
jgi:hypothetical protein